MSRWRRGLAVPTRASPSARRLCLTLCEAERQRERVRPVLPLPAAETPSQLRRDPRPSQRGDWWAAEGLLITQKQHAAEGARTILSLSLCVCVCARARVCACVCGCTSEECELDANGATNYNIFDMSGKRVWHNESVKNAVHLCRQRHATVLEVSLEPRSRASATSAIRQRRAPAPLRLHTSPLPCTVLINNSSFSLLRLRHWSQRVVAGLSLVGHHCRLMNGIASPLRGLCVRHRDDRMP